MIVFFPELELRVDDNDTDANDPNDFTDSTFTELKFESSKFSKLYCKDFKYFKTFSLLLPKSLFNL